MKLYITRHGETPMNAAHRVCGRTDIDLTETGVRQAIEAGQSLIGCGIRRIIASPMRIVKCSPSSPALENTGLNGLHKCVFCSFLVAYCSDLSHLLYSGLPVYTNTYI